jgi:hypothetical protein
MEALAHSNNEQQNPLSVVVNNTPATNSGSKPFIEANTIESTLLELQQRHILPTYRDSEVLISQAEFIQVAGK